MAQAVAWLEGCSCVAPSSRSAAGGGGTQTPRSARAQGHPRPWSVQGDVEGEVMSLWQNRSTASTIPPPGKPCERGDTLPVLKCRTKIYPFPKLPHICQFMQEFQNYLRFFLKKHFFSFSFFSKETKPSMAGYEIWIIYLQTGHKSDPVLEVNVYLVFKAYCLSM